MTIYEKRLAFINESISHFNINNRGISPVTVENCITRGGICSYEAGCIIGRHLDKELCIAFDRIGRFSGVNHVFDRLPEKLKELGEDFLVSLQNMHDDVQCWDEHGLTKEGLEEYNIIKLKFCTEVL